MFQQVNNTQEALTSQQEMLPPLTLAPQQDVLPPHTRVPEQIFQQATPQVPQIPQRVELPSQPDVSRALGTCHQSEKSIGKLSDDSLTPSLAAAEEGNLQNSHLALEKCTVSLLSMVKMCDVLVWQVHSQTGQSFLVTCKLCGWGGAEGTPVSLHKLLYGHYLKQAGTSQMHCLAGHEIQIKAPGKLLLSNQHQYDLI